MEQFDILQAALSLLGIFAIISLSARQLGLYLSRYKLPLISGYLIAGIIVGPYLLDLITTNAVEKLRFVDDIALAFIAFSAGNELLLKSIRKRIGVITAVTIGLVAVSALATFYFFDILGPSIPFAAGLPRAELIAIALVSMMVVASLSPAGTLAVIAELRAKGPLTKTAIGVSVVADVVVILGFAIAISLAGSLSSGEPFELQTLVYLAGEISLSFLLGYLLGKLLALLMSISFPTRFKTAFILLIGYLVFFAAHLVADWSEQQLGHAFHLESLLICLVASFYVTNYSAFRAEFTHLLEEVAPIIYLAFFTLTGAALELDILFSVILIALGLVLVRLVAVIVGGSIGNVVAREPWRRTLVGWMPYVTQAGVGLGLAKSLGGAFADWGSELASLLIGSIILNQLLGPPLFKFALDHLGESHSKRQAQGELVARSVMIFGIEAQSIALARSLQLEDWQVTLVDLTENENGSQDVTDISIQRIPELSTTEMKRIHLDQASVILSMLPNDDDNYKVCEIVYEQFGTPRTIVRLNDSSVENVDRFAELGTRIVNPQTALLSLLNQFVRSPGATSLLLGLEKEQQIADIRVTNQELNGRLLRELSLPSDVLILSLRRDSELVITHGYSKLAYDDMLSVIGHPESIEKVRLLFR